MPKIIDVIEYFPKGYKDYKQTFLLLDVMPKFLYEARGNGKFLVANDDGFYQCYYYDMPGKTGRRSLAESSTSP
jgi:hypothetical protein